MENLRPIGSDLAPTLSCIPWFDPSRCVNSAAMAKWLRRNYMQILELKGSAVSASKMNQILHFATQNATVVRVLVRNGWRATPNNGRDREPPPEIKSGCKLDLGPTSETT